MDTDLVPPIHPLEGSDLNLKNVFPSMVIDELGYIPIDTHGARLLFLAIADVYEQRSLIITTKLALSQWANDRKPDPQK